MRLMMASMIPWAKYRKTYGEAIAKRELVQRRLGRMAGLIVACDAMVQWGGGLIDEGYRGEMECVIAKIFGSESQKEAAIELLMKTHGGRSFLHGHMFGDNVHEYLAPCIYEGEGEMLAMAFFKSLVKQHGVQFFEPVGKALQAAGIKKPNMANPAHLWALRGVIGPYAKWLAGQYMRPKPRPTLAPDARVVAAARRFRRHVPAALAAGDFRHDEQAPTGPGRSPVPHVGAVAAPAGRRDDPLHVALRRPPGTTKSSEQAADIFCQDLTRKITGKPRQRQLLPEGHEAGRSDRRRRIQVDRRFARRRNPDAVRQSVNPAGLARFNRESNRGGRSRPSPLFHCARRARASARGWIGARLRMPRADARARRRQRSATTTSRKRPLTP